MTAPGGVAEEAAKVLSAVEAWLRNAAGTSSSTPTSPGVVADLFAHTGEHRSDSACQICPLCQLISAARSVRPEVLAHLGEAAGSVLLALRAVAEPPVAAPVPGEPAAAPLTVVQHITVN